MRDFSLLCTAVAALAGYHYAFVAALRAFQTRPLPTQKSFTHTRFKDTGVNRHADLPSVTWAYNHFDPACRSDAACVDAADGYNHGTHVSGTVCVKRDRRREAC